MRLHRRSTLYKKPTMSRYLIAIAALACAFSPLAGLAQAEAGALTEEAAVALALSRPAVDDVAEGRIALATAERERIRRWPNPVLSLQHEDTDGNAGTTEDYAWVSQTIDLAGRRRTRAAAVTNPAISSHATSARSSGVSGCTPVISQACAWMARITHSG